MTQIALRFNVHLIVEMHLNLLLSINVNMDQ